jgi:hypothetical protein
MFWSTQWLKTPRVRGRTSRFTVAGAMPARIRLFLSLLRISESVTGDFGIVTGGFGNVTGHFGDVTEESSSGH